MKHMSICLAREEMGDLEIRTSVVAAVDTIIIQVTVAKAISQRKMLGSFRHL